MTKPFSGLTTEEYRGHSDKITSAAWSCDGRRIATCSTINLIVWFTNSKQSLKLHGHKTNIERVIWDAKDVNKLMSVSLLEIRVWQLEGQKGFRCTNVINIGASGSKISVCRSQDGEKIAVATSSTLGKFDTILFIDTSNDLNRAQYETDYLVLSAINWRSTK